MAVGPGGTRSSGDKGAGRGALGPGVGAPEVLSGEKLRARVLLVTRLRHAEADSRLKEVVEQVAAGGFEVEEAFAVRTRLALIKSWLKRISKNWAGPVLVVGACGSGARDLAPEAVRAVCMREADGLERWLYEHLGRDPALRARAGMSARSLMVNVPEASCADAGFLRDLRGVLEASFGWLWQ